MEMSAERIARFEKARDSWLETARRHYFQEFNPVYVWQAVGMCNYAEYPRRALPKWCVDYLVTVAVRIGSLGDLNNPKTYPYADQFPDQEDANEAQSKWGRQKITPAQAIALLPWALQMTRPGWNALARHAAEAEAINLAVVNDVMRDQQMVAKILARKAREANVEPATLKRRVRRGRKLQALPPLPADRFPPE